MVEAMRNNGSLVPWNGVKHIVTQMQFIGQMIDLVFLLLSLDTPKIILLFWILLRN